MSRPLKSSLLLCFLITGAFDAHGQSLQSTCNPDVGRASARISCLSKIVARFNEGMLEMKSQLSGYAKASDLSAYAQSQDLEQKLAAAKAESNQNAKASELSAEAKFSELNQRLSDLQSALSQYAKVTELSAYAKSTDLDRQVAALQSEAGQYVRDIKQLEAKSSDLDRRWKALGAQFNRLEKAIESSTHAVGADTSKTAAFFVRCGGGELRNQSEVAAAPVMEMRSVAGPTDKLPLSYSNTLSGILVFSTSEPQLVPPATLRAIDPTLSQCMPGEDKWLLGD